MKTIWIVDHYSSEPKYSGIVRQYDFAMELERRGYQVVVFSSSFSHFTHSYISDEDVHISEIAPNARFVYLKTAAYSSNEGMGRAVNMVSFMRAVLKCEDSIAKRFGNPDVVTGSSVHPLAWVAAHHIAKKYGIRFCAETRDFWPRVFVVSGEKKPWDPMVLFFGAIQKWVYKRADRIIYSMFHGDKYICGELGISRQKVFLIGQPMDCERFDACAEHPETLPQEIQDFIHDGFICSFAGYYMIYEGVYVMLEAAEILKKRGVPVKMVFVGSGQERDGMLAYAQEHGLDNVLIYDRIPKTAVPALLSRSDICMAHLETKGHKEVYKYGVSKNKVNEYLYSGACTLFGFLYKDDAVALSGGGRVFEPFDAEDLARNIEEIYRMSEEQRKQFGENGRRYIWENHRVQVLTDRMLDVLFGD